MRNPSLEEIIEQICEEDPRYHEQAYHFIREALDYTVKMLEKPTEGPARHVSGQELLEGIRQFALEEYGAMAFTVLEHWNVKSCEDFGNLVFKLVDKGVLGKTDHDSPTDFQSGYDFSEAFSSPYMPARNPDPVDPVEQELD